MYIVLSILKDFWNPVAQHKVSRNVASVNKLPLMYLQLKKKIRIKENDEGGEFNFKIFDIL
jgi:hypothetical protein